MLLALASLNTAAAATVPLDTEHKVIYLTFDDGPSNIVTEKILDILMEKDVKGSFFVVGCKIQGREHILKRIYEEGHAIGLHSYTHNSGKVYASPESLIDEMNKTGMEVNKVLGIYPKIIRFPGGSKPYLNLKLLEKLQQNNYKVYDWNACIPDGINNKAPVETLLKEAKKVIGSKEKVILLLHCDQPNINTVKALPDIIDYYKNEGYSFEVITEDTPEYYFRFKK